MFKIPLFDIDWTLLKGSHAIHNAAFEYAYDKIYNLPGASIHEVVHDGMIDSQILALIAEKHGISKEEAKK